MLDSFLCQTGAELGRITEDQVREKLGIPVWSSIQATAWAAERAMASEPV